MIEIILRHFAVEALTGSRLGNLGHIWAEVAVSLVGLGTKLSDQEQLMAKFRAKIKEEQ